MTPEPDQLTDEEQKARSRSAIDRALRALLVDDVHIEIDPATGDVAKDGGQTPSLTDDKDVNTIG